MKELISVEEADALIQTYVSLAPIEFVRLDESPGRTLAEPIKSGVDIPPFDNSAMDGFAVRAEDVLEVPTELPVSQEIQAGSYPDRPLTPGTCARIMTGAPMPIGSDTVIPFEWTEGHDPVLMLSQASRGHAVRRAGGDVRVGQHVFEGGEIVSPPVVGMLAALGCDMIPVRRPPSCAVLTTGDELVHHTEVPERGQIRNSNGPALVAQVVAAGGSLGSLLTAQDDRGSIRASLETCLESDIVVVSGGVSVGHYDHVKAVLQQLEIDLVFWRVRQRPGKPLLFGVRGDVLIFGLPGNPVSSSICFDRYVRPTIGRMLGRRHPERPRLMATLKEPIRKVPNLRYFARGRLLKATEGELEVVPTGPQGSAIYSSLAHADCIIHLPEDLEDPLIGERVEVEPLVWWG